MRTLALLCAITGLIGGRAEAQEPSQTWQRVVPMNGSRGEINVMKLAANGDIVVAGFVPKPGSGTGRAQPDGWLARYSADGRELWSSTIGGPIRDEVLDLDIVADGSIAIAGWRDISQARAHYAFAAKFDASGKQLWETVVRDTWRNTTASDVRLIGDGGLLFAGDQRIGDESHPQPFVVRLDAKGAIVWDVDPTHPMQGEEQLRVDGHKVTSLSGMVFGALAAVRNDDTVEVLVERHGDAGDEVQSCVVLSMADGAAANTRCAQTALRTGEPGAIFVGGRTDTLALSDAKMSKYRHDGSVEWTRQPVTAMGDGISAIAATPDGGVVGAGFRLTSEHVERDNWDGLLVRFDAAGKLLWSRTFGGSRRDELNGVAVLADGSIIVAGYTGSQPGADDWAPWIMRLNSQGELEDAALAELKARQF